MLLTAGKLKLYGLNELALNLQSAKLRSAHSDFQHDVTLTAAFSISSFSLVKLI